METNIKIKLDEPKRMNLSEHSAFLNSRSLQAVIAMSEYLDANPSTDQGFPLHHPSNDVGADLGSGFDLDTGLTSTLHTELARVNRTLTPFPKQINTCLL